MKIERSDAQVETAARFAKKAGELTDTGFKDALGAIAKEGLVQLDGDKYNWSLIAPALQAVAGVNASLALGAAMNSLAACMVRSYGDDKSLASDIESGKKTAAFVSTPRVGELPRLADKDGKNIVDGTIERVCNAPVADVFIVMAAKGDDVCLVEVDSGADGVSVGEKVDSIGLAALPVAPVSFNGAECKVSATGLGSKKETDFLKARWSICIAAVLCGNINNALNELKNFVMTHTAGDRPVAKFQAPRFFVAEIFASLETSILMLDRAAYALDSGDREAKVLCDGARVLIDDVVGEIGSKGSRILGATGTASGYGFRELLNDAETARFAGEHPDAMLNSIFEFVSDQI